MDVELPLVPIDVHKNLRRLGDGRRGVERMAVAEQGEIGHRLLLEDERAGEHEEIAQHPVAAPVFGQVGEAIEDEERPRPGRFEWPDGRR